jgi:hypothetical protein
MPYTDHFKLADDLVAHLNTIVHSINDPFISSRYVGFVSVVGVTVYELAIKEIFCEFGGKKHKVFGTFIERFFKRINGRIKIQIIVEDYLERFGGKYVNRFKKTTSEAEKNLLRSKNISIISSYNNLIQWRHLFAHEGTIPPTVTYDEAIKSYEAGKEVINCLANTMY